MARSRKTDPPAIQELERLRGLVLQLAVQGKLVEQDPDDEPASVLLERIAAERDELVRTKQIRKPKELPPIDPDDVLYELPDGWEWVRLGQLIVRNEAGRSPKSPGRKRVGEQEWAVLKVSAVSWGAFDPEQHKAVTDESLVNLEHEVHDGDWLMSRANTEELVARSVIADDPPPRLMLSDKHVRLVCPNDDLKRYVNAFNASVHARAYFASVATGTSASMKNVTRDAILRLPVPTPPLAEQQRIVARVDELMAAIDELGAYLRRADTLRPLVLHLAVQGKLVEQDPNDEPASVLLQRIAAERDELVRTKQIRKPKELPPIGPNEVPYELPEGWEWARAGAVYVATDSGWSPRCRGEAAAAGEWGILKTSAVSTGQFVETENKALPADKEPRPEIEVRPGDYVMIRASGSKALVGRGALVTPTTARLMLSDKHIRVRFSNQTIGAYWAAFSGSDVARRYYLVQSSGTSTMSNVTRDELAVLPVPIPPLAEQQRIVKAISALGSAIDALYSGNYSTSPKQANVASGQGVKTTSRTREVNVGRRSPVSPL